jgi:hypothetical protein
MRKGILLLFSGLACLVLRTQGAPIPDVPLEKSARQWTLEGKTFRLSDGETISLYGVTRRLFLGDAVGNVTNGAAGGWYWGQAVYGAVAGRRGGYFEGGGVFGYQASLWRDCFADARLFSGAGGGGDVSEGGGLIVQPALGIGVALPKIAPRLRTFAQAGYARFVNGDIRGWTFGLTLNYAVWELQ